MKKIAIYLNLKEKCLFDKTYESSISLFFLAISWANVFSDSSKKQI